MRDDGKLGRDSWKTEVKLGVGSWGIEREKEDVRLNETVEKSGLW